MMVVKTVPLIVVLVRVLWPGRALDTTETAELVGVPLIVPEGIEIGVVISMSDVAAMIVDWDAPEVTVNETGPLVVAVGVCVGLSSSALETEDAEAS